MGPKPAEAARRLPWAVLEDSIRLGRCRPCTVERYGEAEAQDLEEAWAKEGGFEGADGSA